MDVPAYSVPSLLDCCIDSLIKSLNVVFSSSYGRYHFDDVKRLSLPAAVSDALIKRLSKLQLLNASWLSLYCPGSPNQIRRLNIGYSELSDSALSYLTNQELQELDIANNCNISQHGLLFLIPKSGSTLRHLNISHCTEMIDLQCLSRFVALRSLDVSYVYISQMALYSIGQSLTKLKMFNLSGCPISSLKGIEPLAQTLECLILFNTVCNCGMLKSVLKLKHLRKLDVSCKPENGHKYMEYFAHIQDDIFNELTELEALDLSGIALCPKTFDLFLKVKPKLKFLGLMYADCRLYPSIQQCAKHITGDMNEEQVVLALKMYQDRRNYVHTALRRLFEIARQIYLPNNNEALEAVCQCMLRYPEDYDIQSAGSASVYHFTKDPLSNSQTLDLRRLAISALVVAMEHHTVEPTRVQEFVYKRLARILVVYMTDSIDDFVQRIALQLCNSLVCQVSGENKQFFGTLNFVQLLLKIIKKRHNEMLRFEGEERNKSVHTMHVAWSALWNVTDETSKNCEIFLTNDGLDIFLRCYQDFRNDDTLIVNMLGLLGNVAEVKSLRHYLMREDYVNMFRYFRIEVAKSLLRYPKNALEIGYNAAGILAHLASDGDEAWTVMEVSREDTLNDIVNVSEEWNLKADRSINYRSLTPIIYLLRNPILQVQYFASWALANLTGVYPKKYCPMLWKDLHHLKNVQNQLNAKPRIVELLDMTINRCMEWKSGIVIARVRDMDNSDNSGNEDDT